MTITFDEFLDKMQDALVNAEHAHPCLLPVKLPKYEKVYAQYVCVGGSEGGNCWNDDPSEEYTTNESLDFSDLAERLEDLGFVVPYTKFNKFMRSYIQNYTENEYYGNYSEYQYVIIPICEIYDFVMNL